MVEVDGVVRPYSSFAPSVGNLLNDLGIDIKPSDHVAPGIDESVADGERIVVRHARYVTVDLNGQTTTITTTADSVHNMLATLSARGDVNVSAQRGSLRDEELPLISHAQNVEVIVGETTHTVTMKPGDDVRQILKDAGIAVSPLDRVKATVNNGKLQLVVQTVTRGYVTVNEPIEFTERTVDSGELFAGESEVTTSGVKGNTAKVFWQETVDGKVVNEHLHSSAQTRAPSEQIRSRGTKEVTPIELLKAGIDPKAQLEDGKDSAGRPSKRYRAALGTLSSDAEIANIRAEAQLSGIPLVYSGEDPKAIAQGMVSARGWGDGEFRCLVALWNRESNWNPYAENPSSGAYGIPQSLPGSKMEAAGPDWRTNPATQITWGLNYIAGRYGTPCGAWGHSESVGWY